MDEPSDISDPIARTAVAALRGEKVAPVIDTGVGFVTKENMNTPEMAELLNPPLDQYLK